MNYDFLWNPISRDLEFQSDGELAFIETQSQLSTQNSVILLEGRVMNILVPAAGIGFNSQVIGGDVANAAQQLNRWSQQVSVDGGICQWNRIPAPANVQFDFAANCRYNLPT